MNLRNFLAVVVFLTSSSYLQAKDFEKEYLSGIKRELKEHVNLFKQDSKKLKNIFGFEEKDYFISATQLYGEKKDTIYFLKPISDEKLKKITDKHPDQKIYSIKFENNENPDVYDISNYINDRVIGREEKEKTEIVSILNHNISTYPNPTNGYSNIVFEVPYDVNSLEGILIDIKGEKIKKFNLEEFKKKGKYKLNYKFNSNLSSGVYFFNLQGESNKNAFFATKKLILLK